MVLKSSAKTDYKKRIGLYLLTFGFFCLIGFIAFRLYHVHSISYEVKRYTNKMVDCSNSQKDRQRRCLQAILDEAVKEHRGIEIAAYSLDNLSGKNAIDDSTCHALAHRIGAVAYEYLSLNKPIQFGKYLSVCGYGIEHGIMETLSAKKDDPHIAQQFCDRIDKGVNGDRVKVEESCYHGIGHGSAIHRLTSETVQHLETDVINPSVELCQRFAVNDANRYLCMLGVYHSIGLYGIENGLKFFGDEHDPYAFCKKEPVLLQKPCFAGTATYVKRILNDDFPKALGFINAIAEPEIKKEALTQMVGTFAFADGKRHQFPLLAKACLLMSGEFIQLCISGFAHHIIDFAQNEKGVAFALTYCATLDVPEVYRSDCSRRIVSRVKQDFPKSQMAVICPYFLGKHLSGCISN